MTAWGWPFSFKTTKHPCVTIAGGRVSSVLMLAAFGVAPISLGVAGFLVAWNLKLMFLFAGALMVIAVAGAAFQKPVRQIE
jgi:hypothetical protein